MSGFAALGDPVRASGFYWAGGASFGFVTG